LKIYLITQPIENQSINTTSVWKSISTQ